MHSDVDPGAAAPFRRSGLQQRAQPAEFAEQLTPEIDRARAAEAAAEQHREQLALGQRAGALRQQLFARAFGERPVVDGHGRRVRPWVPGARVD